MPFVGGSGLVGLALAVAMFVWPTRNSLSGHVGAGARPAGPAAGRRAGAADDPAGGRPSSWWRLGRRGSPARAADDRAAHAEVLAMALRAGAGPEAAHELATSLVPAVRHTSEDLLARAVELSADLGTPLLPAVEVCADVARREASAQRRREAALSGVRTSMWLLTALPLVGPFGLGLVGVDVLATYAGSPVAGVSVVVGLALTAAGWWVARAIVRRAVRPVRYRA